MSQGMKLKIRRIKAGMRQRELAALLGTDTTKLSRIECGWDEPKADLVSKIEATIAAYEAGRTQRNGGSDD